MTKDTVPCPPRPPTKARDRIAHIVHNTVSGRKLGHVGTLWALREEIVDQRNETRRWEWEVKRDPALAEIFFVPICKLNSVEDWSYVKPKAPK